MSKVIERHQKGLEEVGRKGKRSKFSLKIAQGVCFALVFLLLLGCTVCDSVKGRMLVSV